MTALPAFGLGTSALGAVAGEDADADAVAVLHAAWDAGLHYLDTAPHYGGGLAERRIGAALRERPRAPVVVSTKVGRLILPPDQAAGRPVEPGFLPGAPGHVRVRDHSEAGIRESLESSLTRLGLSRVDLALLHDPDDHAAEALARAIPALLRLRDEGTVGAVGIAMNQTALLTRAVRETDIDAVLVAGRYTLLDRIADRELLPACAERGVAVIAGAVLNGGLLAAPGPGATYDYRPAAPDLIERAEALRDLARGHGVPLVAAAHQFPLRHPAVGTVLFGAATPEQVRDAVAGTVITIPDALWRAFDAVAESLRDRLSAGRWR